MRGTECRRRLLLKFPLVGTRGFEPPTTRTPSVCATRLRYVPTVRRITLGLPLKQSQDVAEIVAHLREDLVTVRSLDGAAFRQLPASTRDCKTAIVKQVLNLQHHLHVLAAVDTVPCFALLRGQRRKLGFPIPQDKRLHACKFA